MSSLLRLLVLTIIGGIIGHLVLIRETSADDPCKAAMSVCTILWYMKDTIEDFPVGKTCNSTIMMGKVRAAIKTDFSAWVSVSGSL